MTTLTVPRPATAPAPEMAPVDPRVVLISMPWATIIRPSLGLGIISRLCEEQGVPVRTLYGNLLMADRIGEEPAALLADDRSLYGLSEHLFACDLFGADALASETLLTVLAGLGVPAPFASADYIRRVRDELIPAFLTDLCDQVLAAEPTVVGFSATFNQVMGSLALAKRIKARRPDIAILAGGACFDGEMGQEYHRALPEVLDHVFLGEAESAFREYLRRHRAGMPTTGLPGVTWIEDGAVQLTPGEPLQDLNASPLPNYDDFFRQKDAMAAAGGLAFTVESVPFESSRGCWWGERSHCLFCGINDELMPFREKDTERVLDEMVHLVARYGVFKLTAADWIVSKRQRAAIFRGLKALDLDLECFYETRADLTKAEVALMRDAGVTTIQPGIESLSTELLQLMGKGTSRIRVVQFLRWCHEYGIHASYNILAGFPGEQAAWYAAMTAFIPRISHLQPPPENLGFVEMHRFSPLFENRDAFQVETYEIRPDYLFNFPEGLADPKRWGYFFNYASSALLDRDAYVQPLRDTIGDWIARHANGTPPTYTYRRGAGFTRVTDTRAAAPRYLDLTGLHQDLLLLCDEIQNVGRLETLLAAKYPDAGSGGVREAVAAMVAGDLLLQEGPLVLSLPVGERPRSRAQLRAAVFGPEGAPDAPSETSLETGP